MTTCREKLVLLAGVEYEPCACGAPQGHEGRHQTPITDRLSRGLQVNPETGCHEWQGELDRRGYGRMRRPGPTPSSGRRGSVKTHRVAWIIAFGDPRDLHVCHACDNPKCCNPDHLFLGTTADNQRDRVAKGRFIGEATAQARWRDADIVEVRAMYARGATYAEMSEYLGGLRSSDLSAIIHGKAWKHLPGIPSEKRKRREAAHGTAQRYRAYGCRCDLCREARSAANRKNRKKVADRERAV